MSFFERLFCQAPLKLVVEQQNEITALQDRNNAIVLDIAMREKRISELEEKIEKFDDETPEAKKINKKWPKNKIQYRAQDGLKRDVRNLIFSKSYILDPESTKMRKAHKDDTMKSILSAVKRRLRYTPDQKTHNQPEFWQNPEETWQTKKGDCEDGALLIISLARMAGIPAYRIKLCAGWVINAGKKIGHAYCIYLADDGQWKVVDWCYFPTLSLKKPHKELTDQYQEIWWTANDKYTWAQKTTML